MDRHEKIWDTPNIYRVIFLPLKIPIPVTTKYSDTMTDPTMSNQ